MGDKEEEEENEGKHGRMRRSHGRSLDKDSIDREPREREFSVNLCAKMNRVRLAFAVFTNGMVLEDLGGCCFNNRLRKKKKKQIPTG